MKILFIIILYFNVLNQANSQSGWYQQNSNCTNVLTSVTFLNANTGICVGEFGKILMTHDGGLNWDSVTSPTTNALYSVYIIDSNTIVSCGYNRTIIKSTNFGKSWYRITNIADGQNLRCVQFINHYTGYISSEETVLLRSTDSGESWLEINQPYFSANYYGLNFLNADSGYVVGSGGITFSPIIKTTNGGLNWIRQRSFTMQSIQCVKAIDINNALTCGSFGYISRTTNGGNNWNIINSNVGYLIPAISFSTSKIAYFVSGNGTIKKSTDGGLNWINLVSGSNNNLYGVYFINDLTGYVVGNNGTILKTTTGGVVGINQTGTEIPNSFTLKQNYPNPFNPGSHIEFSLSKNNSFVKLNVFDNTGRQFGFLVNQNLDAGTYSVYFDGSHLPSGTYFYRIEVSSADPNSPFGIEFADTKSMILLK